MGNKVISSVVKGFLVGLSVSAVLAGCKDPLTRYSGVFATDEARIWVIREVELHDQVVYRCADTTSAGQPPRPVCVRVPFVDGPTP